MLNYQRVIWEGNYVSFAEGVRAGERTPPYHPSQGGMNIHEFLTAILMQKLNILLFHL